MGETTTMLVAGTHWAAGATAIATCVTALGIFFAGSAALWAARQVRESERSRNAEMATHMFDRWGSPNLESARAVIHQAGRAKTRQCYSAARGGGGSRYENKVHDAAEAIMIFFEELGVMEIEGGLGLSWIQLTMKSSVLEYWKALEPAIRDVRRQNNQETAYENFEVLAYRLKWFEGPKSIRKARQRQQRMEDTTI